MKDGRTTDCLNPGECAKTTEEHLAVTKTKIQKKIQKVTSQVIGTRYKHQTVHFKTKATIYLVNIWS